MKSLEHSYNKNCMYSYVSIREADKKLLSAIQAQWIKVLSNWSMLCFWLNLRWLIISLFRWLWKSSSSLLAEHFHCLSHSCRRANTSVPTVSCKGVISLSPVHQLTSHPKKASEWLARSFLFDFFLFFFLIFFFMSSGFSDLTLNMENSTGIQR